MIVLFSGCTTDTLSMSCDIEVTWEVTVCESLTKEVWFFLSFCCRGTFEHQFWYLLDTHGHFHYQYRVIQWLFFGLGPFPFWGWGFSCFCFPIESILCLQAPLPALDHFGCLHTHFLGTKGVFCMALSCWVKPFLLQTLWGPVDFASVAIIGTGAWWQSWHAPGILPI